ncbi:MAG: EAL domain-containing protein [Clostridia bacterium]|nr:EAL domain-containing protein [Clostridia bacterium]
MGVYSTRLGEVPVSTACDRAKIACDALKGAYGSGFNYYSRALKEEAEKKQHILENLDRAISEGWIQVYYQPIVRAVTEKVCDEEALSRWIDPVRGFLSPGDFIPVLEDAGLIYKLDLYVLEQVLQKINAQKASGFHIVPHSINLSRSDFDACDIVEEIRARVDAARVPRDRITIEITESIIGGDFDFMKTQVERFQALGFPVWMDDFGSGYSSLDVLQSIKFNLLKFDMGFMRKLDEGDSGKIILTELMKMVTSLGVDTICEGVETAAQVHFLQEIGCCKLQGFYFNKPIPLDQLLERYAKGNQIGYENPEESAYYESIGRVNLYDLGVIANEDQNAFHNFFNTLPMGIIEVKGGAVRFVRTNRSYRDFMKRFFRFDPGMQSEARPIPLSGPGAPFMRLVQDCCKNGGRAFSDEQMSDGSTVHAFARKIGANPVTGAAAAAVAVLSISEPDEGESYAEIARTLAADYYNIYVVDLDTDRFIEYASPAGGEDMAVERHGERFFDVARRDNMKRIYPEDRDAFLAVFTRENIVRELDSQGVFRTSCRIIDTGVPMYVGMKITRMRARGNRIILGISLIDALIKKQQEDEKVRRQNLLFGRIAALSGKYYAMYLVDPDTGLYSEYSVTTNYNDLGFDKRGENFFIKGRSDGEKAVHPDDMPYFLRTFTRESFMRGVENGGIFKMRYRLVVNGAPRPIALRAAMVSEADGDKLIVGVNVLDEKGV